MAPRRPPSPGTRPTEGIQTVDERSLAQRAHPSPTDQENKDSEERRSCFYCLEGWVFLGSLDHDGEEIIEAIRCRRCGGSNELHR